MDAYVLCLKNDKGELEPLAWTPEKLSTRQVRRSVRKFRKDKDIVDWGCAHWSRLYSSISEMRCEIPQLV